jgi:hypothetical protein
MDLVCGDGLRPVCNLLEEQSMLHLTRGDTC